MTATIMAKRRATGTRGRGVMRSQLRITDLTTWTSSPSTAIARAGTISSGSASSVRTGANCATLLTNCRTTTSAPRVFAHPSQRRCIPLAACAIRRVIDYAIRRKKMPRFSLLYLFRTRTIRSRRQAGTGTCMTRMTLKYACRTTLTATRRCR